MLFWNRWQSAYRLFYMTLLVFFTVVTGAYLYGFFSGNSNWLSWELDIKAEPVETVAESLEIGPYKIDLPAKTYVATEHYRASDPQINPEYSMYFWLVLGVGASLLLTVSTGFNRFWFLVSMGVFALSVLGLRLELLEFLGKEDSKLAFGIIVSYFAVSYLFHSIWKAVSIPARFVVFASLTALWTFAIVKFSEGGNPVMILTGFGIWPATYLTLAFILFIGTEIFATLLKFLPDTSTSPSGKMNNLGHYLIFCVIYFLNLGMVFYQMTEGEDLGVYLLSPFLIFVIATVAGLFNFEARSEKYARMLPFSPLGAMLYLGFALVATATVAFAFYTGNDPMAEVFEDAIVYSQIGFGIAFLVYVLINYGTLLGRNKAVAKVMYKPVRMPILSMTLLGIGGTVLFFGKSSWLIVDQMNAGRANLVADLYLYEGKFETAKRNYEISAYHGFQNHHANYTLAHLAEKKSNISEALVHLELAVSKQPSPYAYARQAKLYQSQNRFFDALFCLRRGTSKFEGNGQLKNEIGMLYGGSQVLDSAMIWLGQAEKIGDTRLSGLRNRWALTALKDIPLDNDLNAKLDAIEDPMAKANVVAVSNIRPGAPLKASLAPAEGALDFGRTLYLNNISVNLGENDPVAFADFIQATLSDSVNAPYEAFLKYNEALADYRAGRVYDALDLLSKMTVEYPSMDERLVFAKGFIALKNKAYQQAGDFFREAHLLGYPQAETYSLLAMAEAGLLKNTAMLWENSVDSSVVRDDMLYVLKTDNVTDVFSASDQKKALWLRYRSADADPGLISRLENSIRTPVFRADLNLYYASKALANNETEEASRYLKEAEKYGAKANWTRAVKARIALAERKPTTTGLSLAPDEELWLKAQRAEANGERKEADSLFMALGSANPYFTEGMLAALEYAESGKDGLEKAYKMVVRAKYADAYSVRLNMAYIRLALKMGLDNSADRALLEMINYVSEENYKALEQRVEGWRSRLENGEAI
ncbi:hypothetical protein FUAX_05530 [Fulvitalea axinellae]|uniref:Tetratricopeptide repeat protein n=1 Tax=Fulvitalea axinellae TaxID=1182444 RepID=A0AAU9C7P7_9BACT|nr:hypothetical protein FUAX_05530 [Fulvitalea axinellae]